MRLDMQDTVEQAMLRRASFLQKPITGSLELLPLCNMNCDMCYIRIEKKEMEAKGGFKTADEWIQMGQEMAQAGVLFLLLTGGEPLLFPDFKKLYRALKKMGMVLTVNTNGTLLEEEWADFFAQYKPRRINITLYGADDGAYEKLCHYPGGFSKTLKAIQLLKERNVAVKINGSVTKDNRKDMESIYQIGRELKVPVHMDTYMLPGIRERNLPLEKQARLSPEEAAVAEIRVEQMEMMSENFEQYVKKMLAQIEQKEMLFFDQMMCLAGNCSFAMDWQGKIRPCVTLEQPAISAFDKGFLPAWKEISDSAKELKISKKCCGCSLRPLCKICPASAWLETGRYDGVPEYLCRYTKEMVRILKKL